MKQNHKRHFIIKVDEVDFYDINYELKSLLRRVNANGYDVEEIADKLEEIRKSAQLEEEQEVKTVEEINKAISELKEKEISRKAISDGWHTFEELYYHRMMLTLVICRQNRDKAFKSNYITMEQCLMETLLLA